MISIHCTRTSIATSSFHTSIKNWLWIFNSCRLCMSLFVIVLKNNFSWIIIVIIFLLILLKIFRGAITRLIEIKLLLFSLVIRSLSFLFFIFLLFFFKFFWLWICVFPYIIIASTFFKILWQLLLWIWMRSRFHTFVFVFSSHLRNWFLVLRLWFLKFV